MTESQIQAEILRALGSRPDVRLFRNTCGTGWSGQHISGAGNVVTIGNARFVRYGLTPGSADLIGWQAVTVTPEMVGRKLAVFTSIEVKAHATGRLTPEQDNWRRVVSSAGGAAGVARSVAEAAAILI